MARKKPKKPRASREPSGRYRADLLKSQCVEDFRRLKGSLARLTEEVGVEEMLQFATAFYAIERVGLRSPW